MIIHFKRLGKWKIDSTQEKAPSVEWTAHPLAWKTETLEVIWLVNPVWQPAGVCRREGQVLYLLFWQFNVIVKNMGFKIKQNLV